VHCKRFTSLCKRVAACDKRDVLRCERDARGCKRDVGHGKPFAAVCKALVRRCKRDAAQCKRHVRPCRGNPCGCPTVPRDMRGKRWSPPQKWVPSYLPQPMDGRGQIVWRELRGDACEMQPNASGMYALVEATLAVAPPSAATCVGKMEPTSKVGSIVFATTNGWPRPNCLPRDARRMVLCGQGKPAATSLCGGRWRRRGLAGLGRVRCCR